MFSIFLYSLLYLRRHGRHTQSYNYTSSSSLSSLEKVKIKKEKIISTRVTSRCAYGMTEILKNAEWGHKANTRYNTHYVLLFSKLNTETRCLVAFLCECKSWIWNQTNEQNKKFINLKCCMCCDIEHSVFFFFRFFRRMILFRTCYGIYGVCIHADAFVSA